MSGSWNDFNDAKQNSNIIPKGTLAKVRLTIRPADSTIRRRAGPADTPRGEPPTRSISRASSRFSKGPTPGARSSP